MTLASPSPELLALFGAVPTAAGVSVTAESALRSPTTLAACRVIAESVGSLPIHVFRRGPDGAKARETSHPAAAILASDWTPWCGGVETRTAMQMDALLHGAGFGQLVRAGGEIREVHRLDPTAVTHEIDSDSGEPRFRVRRQRGGDAVLAWSEVLFIPTPGWAPGRRFCLIALAREAIALDLVMAEHQGRLFSNGARPSGVLEIPKALGVDAFRRLRESWNAAHAGGPNAGKTAILEEGTKFTALQFSSVDAQLLELRRFVIQEIARVFKVPATLIGDLERATWRNVEELSRQYLQFTLMPWLEIWQAALTRALLRPEERGELFLEFVVDDLLRADLAARFAAYRNSVGGAWLSPNEVRALDNRPPIEGGGALIRQAGQSDTGVPIAREERPADE